MLRIQEEDLNELELKIKEAESKLTSDQADLSKLAISERIFQIEILNEFWNEWIKEDTLWDVAVDGYYIIVLTEKIVMWLHFNPKNKKKLAISVLFI